jgi:RsiW-degrading membrane proteinase PrsW (M82 family)
MLPLSRSILFPYRTALSPALYQNQRVFFFLLFGLFPAALYWLAPTAPVQSIAWMLGVYFAVIWGVVLAALIQPPQISGVRVFQCVVFTIAIGIPMLLFLQQVPPFRFLYAGLQRPSLILQLIGFIFGVGLLEELCKIAPVYLFCGRRQVLDPRTSAFYGAVSGLGFAIAEGANYSLMYATGLAQGDMGFGSYLSITTVRFISLPLIHAIWAAMVGYFLGVATHSRRQRGAIVGCGVAIAAILHGLYDTFAGSIVGLALLAFSILLLLAYLRDRDRTVALVEQADR